MVNAEDQLAPGHICVMAVIKSYQILSEELE